VCSALSSFLLFTLEHNNTKRQNEEEEVEETIEKQERNAKDEHKSAIPLQRKAALAHVVRPLFAFSKSLPNFHPRLSGMLYGGAS
jgi:hypothetical protein